VRPRFSVELPRALRVCFLYKLFCSIVVHRLANDVERDLAQGVAFRERHADFSRPCFGNTVSGLFETAMRWLTSSCQGTATLCNQGGDKMKSLTTASTVRWRIAAVARSSFDRDGSVLLDTEKGVFYGANSLGSKIWESIRQCPEGITAESLLGQVICDVDVPRDQFGRDLNEYLKHLESRGLLTTQPPR
jgi:hypothetical protein